MIFADKYLTIAEVAKRLKVSVQTATRLFRHVEGVLNAGTQGRLMLRIPESALARYMRPK